VLTAGEVAQAARSAAPDATVTNHSTEAEVDLPAGEHKTKVPLTAADRARHGAAVVTTRTTIDRPLVEVAFPGGLRVELGVVRPGQPDARWLAVTFDGDRRLSAVELHGTGDVGRVLAVARELAGLPSPDRRPQAGTLAFGDQAGRRDTATPPGGAR
jgi:hypothetical protein